MSHTFTKENVSYQEYFIHDKCYSLLKDTTTTTNINIHIPKIISYNADTKCLVLERVNGDNLSNIYGENITDVPVNIITIIRQFLKFLCEQGIDYIDITGYNFMFDVDENIWIIDFEHAKIRTEREIPNDFLERFIHGELSWNTNFT